MATRKKRGGRAPIRTRTAATSRGGGLPSGATFRLYVSDALRAVVGADEPSDCFKSATRNLKSNFQLVNDGNASVTHCKSRSGVGYWIVVDLSHPNHDGSLDVHAGLPHEFGQGN